MRIRRLGYAGIEIEASGEIIVIDLLTDTSTLSVLREPDEVFPSPSQPSAAMLALVTHLHVVRNWIATASLTGCPATIAPVGITQNGLPIGIQIMGPFWEDATPIRFAELLSQETEGFRPPPSDA